jgi:hypothetical protein
MSRARSVLGATLAAVALAAAACGDDDGSVQVIQGEFRQAVPAWAPCEADNVFDRTCSRRDYPQTTFDSGFVYGEPATVRLPQGTRVELTLLREIPGRERPRVVWEDEEQCIDSVCLSETTLSRRVTARLRGPFFIRIVAFSDQARGFELRGLPH